MGQSLRERSGTFKLQDQMYHSAHTNPRTKTISMSILIPVKKSIFSAHFRMPPPPPPPPPPVPQAKKGLGKLTMSANKKTLLFNSKVIKRLEPKRVKNFKPSRKSVAEEAEFLKIVKTIYDTYAALPGKSGVENYFMNMLGKALKERRDLQNLLLSLKTALRSGGRARDSQLVHNIIFHKTNSSRINHSYHYYNFRDVSNVTPDGQTHIIIGLNREGQGLNKVIIDLVPIFSFMARTISPSTNANLITTTMHGDLSHALLQPIHIDITRGVNAVSDLDEMAESFLKHRKKLVLATIKTFLTLHNETIGLVTGTPSKVSIDAFLKDEMNTTPLALNLNTIDIGKLRVKLTALSFSTLKSVLKQGSLGANRQTGSRLKEISVTMESLLNELTEEKVKIAQVKSAIFEFKKKLEKIKNVLLRPSVKAHPLYSKNGTNASTIRTILESLKGEISHIMRAFLTTAEPEKTIPGEISDTVVKVAAESLSATHPELVEIRRQLLQAEKKAAALAAEKLRLEANISSILARTSNLERGRVSQNASIASATQTIKDAEGRLQLQRKEIRQLKKRLRVYTLTVISGAVAAAGAYATGFGKRSKGSVPGTRGNVNKFVDAAQSFDQGAFIAQALGGASHPWNVAKNSRGATKAVTVRDISSNSRRLGQLSTGVSRAAPRLLPGPSGVSGIPSGLGPSDRGLGPSDRGLGPSGSGLGPSGSGLGPPSSLAVPIAAGLLGGAYLAKRLAARRRRKMSSHVSNVGSWVRGNSGTAYGNVFNNNIANTAQSRSSVERHMTNALRYARKFDGVLRKEFPAPRRR